MSKTVKIPDDVSRMEITINNKTYVYQGGATVTVPDEVADLLENNAATVAKGKRPAGESYDELGDKPQINGVELTGNKSGGSLGLYEKPATGIPATDLAQGVQDKLDKFVVTLTPIDGTYGMAGVGDKKQKELNAAYTAGKQIVLTLDVRSELYINLLEITPDISSTAYNPDNVLLSAVFNIYIGTEYVLCHLETQSNGLDYFITYSITPYTLTPYSS